MLIFSTGCPRFVKVSVALQLLTSLLSIASKTLACPATGYCTMEAAPESRHVVIVGGGLAGLTAALEVVKNKGRVTIIEKCAKLGGNSAKASSGINGAETAPQNALGIPDSTALFKEDTLRSGKGRCAAELVDVLVNKSAGAIDALQSLGIDLSNIAQCGGHSRPRTHRAAATAKATNIGGVIMHTLIDHLHSLPPSAVQVLTNTRALELLQDSRTGRVKGVRCRVGDGSGEGDRAVEADAVVLATGGYSADREGLLQKHVPGVSRLATTNGAWATGDGVKLGLAIGAGSVDLDQVQLHPTGLVDPKDPTNPTKFLAPEALRAIGGILLNQKGERFVDELSTRDVVAQAILEHCQPLQLEGATKRAAEEATLAPVTAFLVLNDESVERFGRSVAEFYMKMGFMQKFATEEELCDHWRLPVAHVARTLDEYGRVEHDAFGKPSAPVLFRLDQSLYTCLVTPSLHYTMGGLKIDTGGRVLTQAGDVIPGLWAAGEVTGGVHGANRLAGNSLLECMVFGKLVGEGASDPSAEQQPSPVPSSERQTQFA
ncbi:hypothetical protein KFL_000580150 [Klebsormidium nitens]|uniref:fumarate reductase (NADH) n=1 Tax=Klebsormidium nitens TaxID=105231 RepID=A0A1Y1HUE9_KLENI|nr:hypothetical protein KFL_000580150 [Klebsormidium nitens]|eukprot:GAQ80621.1 hypothetical protein KFL_000580150 [Klebsormidium nitens]